MVMTLPLTEVTVPVRTTAFGAAMVITSASRAVWSALTMPSALIFEPTITELSVVALPPSL